MSNMIARGIEIAKQATEADHAGDYERAFGLYKQCLQYFTSGLQYEKNPKKREILEMRASEYMSRAEELKKMLEERQTSSQPSRDGAGTQRKPSGGNGGGNGGDGKDDEDEDSKKLQGALAEAIVREKPNVHWSDVAGQEAAKRALNEAVLMPIKFPQIFQGKIKPWRGILMYGPPGTGKSYLAKAVATEVDSTFFSISASRLMSKWQGESERLVRELFELARKEKPSIIFLDEVDSLCSERGEGQSESASRVKTEFLVQMDGVGSDQTGILVLAATNFPWVLDRALRRRFQKRIYISLPDYPARRAMFKIHLGDTKNTVADHQFDDYARRTEGFSSDDIGNLVNAALYAPITRLNKATHFRQVEQFGKMVYIPCDPSEPGAEAKTLYDIPGDMLGIPIVEPRDFEEALLCTKPTVNQADIDQHAQFTREFGSEQ